MLTRDILRYIPQRIHCVQIPWLRSITVRLAGVLLSVLDNLVRSLSVYLSVWHNLKPSSTAMYL